MTSAEPGRHDDETNTLLSRLRVIEDQPLDTRAESFAQIHEQLRTTLEGGEQSA
jgi:hypothetical protein